MYSARKFYLILGLKRYFLFYLGQELGFGMPPTLGSSSISGAATCNKRNS